VSATHIEDQWRFILRRTGRRGQARLQRALDRLPRGEDTCRDAYCGFWERCNGYVKHPKHDADVAPDLDVEFWCDGCYDQVPAEACNMDSNGVTLCPDCWAVCPHAADCSCSECRGPLVHGPHTNGVPQ
jgi:hypothetical protein